MTPVSALTRADIGRLVIYRTPHQPAHGPERMEIGEIQNFDERRVFVRFEGTRLQSIRREFLVFP